MNIYNRNRFDGTPLSQDAKVRQGRVVRSARETLGSVDAVRSFLNSHHGALGARPLDLAMASDAGLLRVEKHLDETGHYGRTST